jgi:hypothetical protein
MVTDRPPVAVCTKCGGFTYQAERVNQQCGKLPGGKRCKRAYGSALNKDDAAGKLKLGHDPGSRPLAFGGRRVHNEGMDNLQFDRTDYSVVVKARAPLPNPWRWEIYRAGRSSPIRQSTNYFQTMVTANREGKEALKQLLEKLHV